MECNARQNMSFCTCTYEPCERKGNCCKCIQYHRQAKQLPGCLFPPEAERTYDRSIAKFISCVK
jgi:hypothetical protein